MLQIPSFNPQLTAHFHVSEFACKDGTQVPWDCIANVQILANQLEVIRLAVNEPITIISGFRNKTYNKTKNGATKSYHIQAMAADLRASRLSAAELHRKIKNLISAGLVINGGLALYSSFVHYDIRIGAARWNLAGLK